MPKGYSKRNQGGWRHTDASLNLMSKNRRGVTANENNPRWKGDNVSYAALHNWVRSHYKKPDCCEICGKNPGVDIRGHNKLQWSNISKRYLRRKNDWQCLCISCHRKYDLANKVKHKYAKQ